MSKKFTFRALLKAIRQNGYTKTKHQFYEWDFGDGTEKKKLVAACAFGQAALNLGVNVDTLCDSYYDAVNNGSDGVIEKTDGDIVYLNDDEDLPMVKIANRVEAWLTNNGYNLDTPFLEVG
jgi:hypothetical protein